MQLFILSVTQTLDNQTMFKNMFLKKDIPEGLKRTDCIYHIIYKETIYQFTQRLILRNEVTKNLHTQINF